MSWDLKAGGNNVTDKPLADPLPRLSVCEQGTASQQHLCDPRWSRPRVTATWLSCCEPRYRPWKWDVDRAVKDFTLVNVLLLKVLESIVIGMWLHIVVAGHHQLSYAEQWLVELPYFIGPTCSQRPCLSLTNTNFSSSRLLMVVKSVISSEIFVVNSSARCTKTFMLSIALWRLFWCSLKNYWDGGDCAKKSSSKRHRVSIPGHHVILSLQTRSCWKPSAHRVMAVRSWCGLPPANQRDNMPTTLDVWGSAHGTLSGSPWVTQLNPTRNRLHNHSPWTSGFPVRVIR